MADLTRWSSREKRLARSRCRYYSLGDSPAAYLPDLAMSLNNLGNRLSDVGQWEEALEVGRQAVSHYRDQAAHHCAPRYR